MRTRPRSKFKKATKARRCAKCGSAVNSLSLRCKKCGSNVAKPKK